VHQIYIYSPPIIYITAMTAIPKIYRKTTLLALAALAMGCSNTAVRNEAGAVPAAMMTVDNGEGTFTDPRDNQRYRTVKIGNHTWMAENLNFKTGRSVCYDNADSNCTKYGRLYVWEDAQTACPAGWRVPSDDDWDTLARASGGRQHGWSYPAWHIAGQKLKSTTGWEDLKNRDGKSASGNGTDDFGFSALPGGYCISDYTLKCYGNGFYAEWLASGNDGAWQTLNRDIHYDSDAIGRNPYFGPDHLFSLRCLQGPIAARKDVDTVRAVDAPWSAGDQFNPNIAYGSLVYEGQTYRTVKIGAQIWMAENLNFKTGRSVCYDNADSNCTKYGRLYVWEDAQTACPAGWRVPTNADWDNLFRAAGGKYTKYGGSDNDYVWDIAAKKLKSTIGWNNWRCDYEQYLYRMIEIEECIAGEMYSGNGTDEFGFSALQGGSRLSYGKFYDADRTGRWWSATEYNSDYLWCWLMSKSYEYARKHVAVKSNENAFSLRCLQDTADLR